MRSAFLAVGLALAVGAAATAATPTGGSASSGSMPSATDQTGMSPHTPTPPGGAPGASPTPENAPMTPPATTPSTNATGTGPATSDSGTASTNATASANPAAGAAANTSATAPTTFRIGQSVQDNTGASIGTIDDITTVSGQQMAVIKMGSQSFQVPTSRLGENNGAAEINLTKAQIAAMLHTGH